MNEPSQHVPLDPELEARIVAMVLGEASDFEREQLQQLIDQQPALAAFASQMQSVHHRLQAVATSDVGDRENDWQLPDEKRQPLLAKIDSQAEPPAGNRAHFVTTRPVWRYSKTTTIVGALTGIAAMVMLIGLLSPSIHMARENARVADFSIDGEFPAAMEDAPDMALPLENAARTDGVMKFSDGFGGEATDEVMMDDMAMGYGEVEISDMEMGVGGMGMGMGMGDAQPPSAASASGNNADGNGEAGAGRGVVTRQPRGESNLRASVKAPETHWGQSTDVARYGDLPKANVPSQFFRSDARPNTNFHSGLGSGGFAGGVGGLAGPPSNSPQPSSGDGPMPDVPPSGLATPTEGEEDFSRSSRVAKDSTAAQMFDLSVPDPVAATATDELDAIVVDELKQQTQDFSFDSRSKREMVKRLADQSGELSKSRESERQREQGLEDLFGGTESIVEEEAEAAQTEFQPQVLYERQLMTEAGKPVVADARLRQRDYAAGLNETVAAVEPFSTFSLHVSDVSFKLAYAALAAGEAPEPAKVRIEEFVNAFDYGDPMPSHNEKVACRVEQAIHPFLQQRNVLRVSMRTAAAGRASTTPLRLTLLLDNSGSMERVDRQQTVRRAVAQLAQQLTPADRVTLISFARQPRLLADQVPGDQAQQLVERIDSLPREGGTNIEAALQLAFEKAKQQQLETAQNRIVLLTDGAVNLGNANPERLSQQIITMRDAGIAFDAAGISAEGLNDEVLEALTRKGDGRYYLLDTFESVDDGFAKQLAGALRPSAKNVKVQIEFNPRRVGRYKLLGFEKHILNKEDFRNDAVDAAEMAAAEAGVAVYQFEAKPDGQGDVGSVSVRFRDLSSGQMVENRWPIPYVADAPRIDQAAASLQIATSAALLAAKLRGEPLGATVDLKRLSQLIAELPQRQRSSQRIEQLHQMIEQARSLGF